MKLVRTKNFKKKDFSQLNPGDVFRPEMSTEIYMKTKDSNWNSVSLEEGRLVSIVPDCRCVLIKINCTYTEEIIETDGA